MDLSISKHYNPAMAEQLKKVEALAEEGICLRPGLNCAPLAHESAGTLQTGTLRVSFGHDATAAQVGGFLRQMAALS